MKSILTSLIMAAALALSGVANSAIAAADDSGFEITYPGPNISVDPDELRVQGTVPGLIGEDELSVVYIVDVSGSTESRAGDCNGNGDIDEYDDINQDGQKGTILDCELAGVLAIHGSVVSQAGSKPVGFGLVAFGSEGVAANFGSVDKPQRFVSASAQVSKKDPTPKIIDAISSLKSGDLSKYNPSGTSPGGGTNFNSPLQLADSMLADREGGKIAFFMSDGEGDYSDSAVPNSEIPHRTYAIGTASDQCEDDSPLSQIATKTHQACTFTERPAEITAAINQSSGKSVRSIEVSIDEGPLIEAEVDLLGNWSADVGVVVLGTHSVKAILTRHDGTTETQETTFEAKLTDYEILAIGDSYISGEGAGSYDEIGDNLDKCHRSSISWARQVKGSVNNNTRLVACSGAVARDVTTSPQRVEDSECTPTLVTVNNEEEYKAAYHPGKPSIPWSIKKTGAIGKSITVATCVPIFSSGTNPVQIDSIRGDENLILLSVGGNDAAFGPILKKCILTHFEGGKNIFSRYGSDQVDAITGGELSETESSPCASKVFAKTSNGKEVRHRDFINARMVTIASQLTGVYDSIENRSNAGTDIVVATYPRIFSANSSCAYGLGFHRDDVNWIRSAVDRLDSAIVRRGRMSSLEVVDTRAAFEDNLLCDYGADKAFVGADLIDQQESFHPNEKGQEIYREVVQDRVRELRFGTARMRNVNDSVNDVLSSGESDALSELVAAGFSSEEIEEIALMEAGFVDFRQAGDFAEVDQCDVPVPGEVLTVQGSGFAPGSSVEVSIGGNEVHQSFDASSEGVVSGTLTITTELEGGHFGVQMSGTNRTGDPRILSGVGAFEADSECKEKAETALSAITANSGVIGTTGSITSGSLGSAGSSGGSLGIGGSGGAVLGSGGSLSSQSEIALSDSE